MDLRKVFVVEATARLGSVLQPLGFAGPEAIGDVAEYPAALTMRWRRASVVVETVLVQAYGGDEYVRSELTNDAGERTVLGDNTVRSARQLRTALGEHAAHAGTALG